jgi:hypothetical protein
MFQAQFITQVAEQVLTPSQRNALVDTAAAEMVHSPAQVELTAQRTQAAALVAVVLVAVAHLPAVQAL